MSARFCVSRTNWQREACRAGIDGYDLLSLVDLRFAFDYDHIGKLDHLVFYRSDKDAFFIIKNNNNTFILVYNQIDPESEIDDYDLLSPMNKAFAFDYDHSDK